MPRRRFSTTTIRAWVGFALIVALVMGSALAIGLRLSAAAEARAAVEAASARIERLNLLMRQILDAEVGQRGYIIAGDERFLEPYLVSKDEVGGTLDAITRDAQGSPIERQRGDRLGKLLADKFAFMRSTIDLRRTQGLDAATEKVAGLEGKRLMDEIRAEIGAMAAFERNRLAERGAELQDADRLTQQVIYAALIGALFLVLAIGLMLLRQLRGRIEAQRLARQAAALLRVTLDNIGVAVVVTDREGRILGRNAELLRLIPAAAEGSAPEAIADELTLAREGRSFLFERDVAAYTPAVVRGVPLPGRRFLVTYLDATDARRADRLKSEFVSTVSHELRTPVTSIRGALGMLAGPLAAGLSDTQASLTDMALRNADRLSLLVNDILDMEKIESGRMAFDIRPHDLNQLLQDAAETNRSYAEARGVTLALGTLPRPLNVRADSHRIQQVMANLISNAVKFSDNGGIVTLTAEEGDGVAYVSVADQGPGIPEAFKSRMFERFAQADATDTRAKGGTGLGLSIAKAIVDRHGGGLSFESEPGNTIFTFTVPLTGAGEPS
ncbi:CHASE3 domain-containing protein [Sphingoaurantiacus capsulatus]|uniref:histidine kinase n=1 Tax=Sphingoaurantiacus capsulatus TaxID=1771310 RepID=A0ABV7XA66_9SPHN